MSDLRRQEIHCHACMRWVQFDLDMSLNGNHVLECPNCGHEHCRVVKDGEITGERWDSRNGNTFTATGITFTTASSFVGYTNMTTATTTAGAYYLHSAWANSGRR